MKRIVITGVTGFVGKHLATQLISQKDYEITGTYRSESSLEVLEDIRDQIKLKKLDLHDVEAVESVILSTRPDGIFHLAAQASPMHKLLRYLSHR